MCVRANEVTHVSLVYDPLVFTVILYYIEFGPTIVILPTIYSYIYFLQSGQGDTALTVACYNGYCDIARFLLDQGATIDYENRVRSLAKRY